MRSFLFSLYSSKELAQVSEETKDEDASFPQYPNEHKVPQNKLAYKVLNFFREIFCVLLRMIWAIFEFFFSYIWAVIKAIFRFLWQEFCAPVGFLLRGFHFWCIKNKVRLSFVIVLFLLGTGFYFGIKYQESIQGAAFKYFVGTTNSTNKSLFDLNLPGIFVRFDPIS